VIDRTGLILEIFGERAATAEGRLQVELAHLDYQAGRPGAQLDPPRAPARRLRLLGGPGETQIEADRRLIRDRMAKLRKELEQVSRTRTLHRARRQRAPWPVIALVGYTNAGKSTLFNRLTSADVMAENLLFATLDPTMREFAVPGFDKAILSDTGRVHLRSADATRGRVPCDAGGSDLGRPHHPRPRHLASRHGRAARRCRAGAQGDRRRGRERAADDRGVEQDRPARVRRGGEHRCGGARKPDVVAISARSGEGVDLLVRTAAERLREGSKLRQFSLPSGAGEAMAWLHANGEVVDQQADDVETAYQVRLSDADWARFQTRYLSAA
jgi:GTP-binding protein HflX